MFALQRATFRQRSVSKRILRFPLLTPRVGVEMLAFWGKFGR
jgi:hypothetical protein